MQFLKKEGRSVFNYPFILPLNIKNRILKEQYSDKMKNSLKDAFFLSLFKGEVPPYLSLIVRRQYIYEDTVEQLDEADSLNKQLKISFDREEGVDVGGITREFFQLLSYQIVHERDLFLIKNEFIWPKIMNHGQFISESHQNLNLDYDFRFNYLKMNRNKEEQLKEYNYIGKIIALGLYNSFVLNIPFPLIFFKKLLGNEKYTLEDIKEIEPEIYNSLSKLRSFTDEEFHYMEQTFMITYSSDKNLYSKELVKNGGKIFVNRKNFDEFFTQYVHWIVHSSIEHSFNALKEGFYSIIDYETVRCLHPAEMEKILVGSFIVDLHFLRKHIKYVDYTADSNIVLWFWEIIEKYNTENLRKLLQFVTGNDKVPVINTAEWKIIIKRNGCDTQRLPSSQTCFNTLLLPEYSSKSKLGEKLNIAIRYTKGFYLM